MSFAESMFWLPLRPGLHVRPEKIDGIGPWVWVKDDVWGWEQPKDEWPALRDLILANVKSRRGIIQAGGCCGMYPRLWAEHFRHVYTFEPDARNFYCLALNCPSERIIKIQAALSFAPGTGSVEHTAGDFNVGMHRISMVDALTPAAGFVPILTLDDMEFDAVDAIQLDCEGNEENIISGAGMTIAKHRPLISIEAPSEDLRDDLKKLGYSEVGRCGSNPDVVFTC